jgi:hypothetical protein
VCGDVKQAAGQRAASRPSGFREPLAQWVDRRAQGALASVGRTWCVSSRQRISRQGLTDRSDHERTNWLHDGQDAGQSIG